MIVARRQAAAYAVYIRPRCTSQAAASPSLLTPSCPASASSPKRRSGELDQAAQSPAGTLLGSKPPQSPSHSLLTGGLDGVWAFSDKTHSPSPSPSSSDLSVGVVTAPKTRREDALTQLRFPLLRRPKTTAGCPDRDATMRIPHEEPEAATIVGVGLAMTSVCFFSSFLSQSAGVSAAERKAPGY